MDVVAGRVEYVTGAGDVYSTGVEVYSTGAAYDTGAEYAVVGAM